MIQFHVHPGIVKKVPWTALVNTVPLPGHSAPGQQPGGKYFQFYCGNIYFYWEGSGVAAGLGRAGGKCARSKFVDVFLVWGWPSAHRTAGIVTMKLCCIWSLQISKKGMSYVANWISVFLNTFLFFVDTKSICLTSYFCIPETGQIPKEVAQISFQSGLIVQIIEGPRLQSHADNFIITGRGPESAATKYQQMAAENTAIHVF